MRMTLNLAGKCRGCEMAKASFDGGHPHSRRSGWDC